VRAGAPTRGETSRNEQALLRPRRLVDESTGVEHRTVPPEGRPHHIAGSARRRNLVMEYSAGPPTEKTMAIQAQRNRARLHVLRDNVHRAARDVKRKLPGAAERLKAHRAKRLAFAETGK
jgi:hypothetical protein